MERSKGRHYTAVCLARDHRDAYIHTMKPPEISPVYGTFQDFQGQQIHVDWEGISGRTIRSMMHAFSAVYGR